MCISLKKNSRNVLIFAFKSKRHQCGIHPLILLNCIFISDFTPLCTLQLIRAHFYVKQKIFPWRDFMEIESPLIIFRLTISSFYDATLFCHRAYTYILGMYVHILSSDAVNLIGKKISWDWILGGSLQANACHI